MSLVSVILPSCDSERWIHESVESVLTQSYQKLELIVIDDHSSDASLKILDGYSNDPRVTIIRREKRSGGPATPRNIGVKLAKGDYFAFIDSDDVWHPQKLEAQMFAMQKHQLNFLSTARVNFHGSPPKPEHFDTKSLEIQFKNHKQLLSKNWVVTSSAIVSKALLATLKFDESKEYVGVEDYLLWLYAHQQKEIQSAILNAPMVFYRLRQNSISSSKRAMASKVFYLLSNYQINNTPLGPKKYYYFMTYALSSFVARISRHDNKG